MDERGWAIGPADIARVLQQLPGFEDATYEALEALARHFEVKQFKREFLTKEGAPADALFVLVEGELEVLKRSKTGRDYHVATFRPVALCGHVGILTREGRTASLRAPGAVTVLQMGQLRLSLVLRSPDFEVVSPFRRALILAISRQLAVADATLAQLAIDAGIAEPDPNDPGAQHPPEPADAEHALLRAQGSV